ncbi:hypothetical protein RRG08_064092, partial [Elysia crispata]
CQQRKAGIVFNLCTMDGLAPVDRLAAVSCCPLPQVTLVKI